MNEEHSKLGIIDDPKLLSNLIKIEEYGVSGAQEVIITYNSNGKPDTGGWVTCMCCCGGGAGQLEEEDIVL